MFGLVAHTYMRGKAQTGRGPFVGTMQGEKNLQKRHPVSGTNYNLAWERWSGGYRLIPCTHTVHMNDIHNNEFKKLFFYASNIFSGALAYLNAINLF